MIGGSLWIILSGSLSGAGSIEAIGGRGYSNGYGTGAGGRISICSADQSGFIGSVSASTDGSGSSNAYEAACGTIYLKDVLNSNAELIIDTGGNVPSDNRVVAGIVTEENTGNVFLLNGGALEFLSTNASVRALSCSANTWISLRGGADLDLSGLVSLNGSANTECDVYVESAESTVTFSPASYFGDSLDDTVCEGPVTNISECTFDLAISSSVDTDVANSFGGVVYRVLDSGSGCEGLKISTGGIMICCFVTNFNLSLLKIRCVL